jgi:predicted RNA binding protein YcfA (HicA-like mRNA interferase family)
MNYEQLRSLTAREIASALIRDGFTRDRQVGSHRHYCHPDGRRVTLTYHASGETFRMKTLKSMIETQAYWTEDDLKRLKLMK